MPGIAQDHGGLLARGLGRPKGMAHQGPGQPLLLIPGQHGQGAEGDGVQPPAAGQFDPAGGAGDLSGQPAVRLAHEGQLRPEGGGLAEQVEIVVLVTPGLIDVPEGLPHQLLHGPVLGGALLSNGDFHTDTSY